MGDPSAMDTLWPPSFNNLSLKGYSKKLPKPKEQAPRSPLGVIFTGQMVPQRVWRVFFLIWTFSREGNFGPLIWYSGSRNEEARPG